MSTQKLKTLLKKWKEFLWVKVNCILTRLGKNFTSHSKVEQGGSLLTMVIIRTLQSRFLSLTRKPEVPTFSGYLITLGRANSLGTYHMQCYAGGLRLFPRLLLIEIFKVIDLTCSTVFYHSISYLYILSFNPYFSLHI